MRYSDLLAAGVKIAVVASDTARNNLLLPSDGMIVLTSSDNAINIYSTSSGGWIKINTGAGASVGGLNYLEIKPSSIYPDDTLDGVTGGELFNILPSYDFSPLQQGAVFFDFDIPNNWYLNSDILFDLYFTLDGADFGKNVKLKGEYWVINQGDTEAEGTPVEISYDLIASSSGNTGNFYVSTLTGIKVSSASLSSTTATIAVRFTRLSGGVDPQDNYGGVFKLVKIGVKQANYQGQSQLFGNNDLVVVNKITDYTLLSSDSGKLFHTAGAVESVTFILPPAQPGNRFEIAKIETPNVTVKSSSGDWMDGILNGSYKEWSGGKNSSIIFSGLVSGKWSATCKAPGWLQPGDRGVFGGGIISQGNFITAIDYITISSIAAPISFGQLTVARYGAGATSSGVNDRGVFAGGTIGTSSSSNVIDYITISSASNAASFGQLSVSRGEATAVSNGSNDTGVFCAGSTVGQQASGATNVMDYITISSLGNAASFGQVTQARDCTAGCSNGVNNRGVIAGGCIVPNASFVNTIDCVTINVVSNSVDFGDLTASRQQPSGCSNGTNDRGLFIAGSNASLLTVMDYVAISVLGNAAVFGQVTQARGGTGALSNGTNERAVFGGGWTSASVNTIDYVTIAILGNSSSFGQLSSTRSLPGGTSNA